MIPIHFSRALGMGVKMRFSWTWLIPLIFAATGATALDKRVSEAEIKTAEEAVARFTSPQLARFSGEPQFRDYVDAVRNSAAISRKRWVTGLQAPPVLAFAQALSDPDPTIPVECPADEANCVEDQSIVVTGSRVSARNPSITNNQMRGIEEGDIVKQIDHFLLILQDGRVFVVDTRASGGRKLKLTDVANVYRDPKEDMWYDEMLVTGDRILVTGYSYENDATELSVLKLDAAGRLHRQGTFAITSDDYYSGSNYATRLIGDALLVYTPFNLLDMTSDSSKWPVIRRWQHKDERPDTGKSLFDAASIYKPVRTEFDPTIHTVSVCPLGSSADIQKLECRTTAFVGASAAEWYVTADHTYVWTAAPSTQWSAWPEKECTGSEIYSPEDLDPALIYRLDHQRGAPTIAAARGAPIDQFSMQQTGEKFYALLRTPQHRCSEPWGTPARLSFYTAATDAFSGRLTPLHEEAFTPLPGTGSRWIANRFTDRYLVYGGLSNYRRGPPDLSRYDEETRRRIQAEFDNPGVVVVPVERPRDSSRLAVGHSVIRAEQLGTDIVVTGYKDRRGLVITRLGLSKVPRIASSIRLDGRFESEGRSHAFNSLLESGGRGLLGLPTVAKRSDSGRYWWRSTASDVSFIRIDRSGTFSAIGELERKLVYNDDDGDDDGIAGYACEVSCIDWYGNSRPIFTDGRIFALSGAELIEGVVEGSSIEEVQRVNFARDSTRLTERRKAQLSARYRP